jgi:hypothetical protein
MALGSTQTLTEMSTRKYSWLTKNSDHKIGSQIRDLLIYEIVQETNLSVGMVNTVIHKHFMTGCASIIQDQAFQWLNVHTNYCCGLGITMAGIVTDGRTAIFETFTPFKMYYG